mgnify:CR=1 FL=1
MNTSILETARNNRIEALEKLRAKKLISQASGQVLSLQTMRDKMADKPVFRSVRVHRFEGRLAA